MKAAATVLTVFFLAAAVPHLASADYEVVLTSLSPEAFTPLQVSSRQIELLGAWSKTTLQVYINPSGSEILDSAAKRGVEVWYGSVRAFVNEYGYSYLLTLSYSFVLRESDADVSVVFVDSLGNNVCGLASLRYNSFTRAIVRASIQISKACVGSNPSTAYKVVAHEYGHALGLDHSSYALDLMYSHLNTAELPSTLNIYALAIAYEWLTGMSFRSPSRVDVALPDSIPYKYVAPAPESFIIRVLMESELGRAFLNSSQITYGGTFRYMAQQSFDFGNGTLLLFEGWFANNVKISESPQLEQMVSSHMDFVAKYGVYYHLYVKRLEGVSERWVRKGQTVEVDAVEFSLLGEGTRLRFVGWNDGETERVRQVVVKAPARLEALYVKEHRVEVNSSHDVIQGDGWYREGSTALLKVVSQVLQIGKGERMKLTSLNSSTPLEKVDNNTYRVLVDKPITVEALWTREFQVLLESSHGTPTIVDAWLAMNDVISVSAERVFSWSNMTRAVFIGWQGLQSNSSHVRLVVEGPLYAKAVYQVHYFIVVESIVPVRTQSGWVVRGEQVLLDPGPVVREAGPGLRHRFAGWHGMGNESTALVSVLEPSKFVAEWVLEALVEVETLDGYLEFWRPVGQSLSVQAEKVVQKDESRRFVFLAWTGDIKEAEGLKATVQVDGPKKLKTLYRPEVLVQPSFISETGQTIDAYAYVKILDGNEIVVKGGSTYWLPTGDLELKAVLFREVDVKKGETIVVDQPGLLVVETRVRNLLLRVRDVFGVPFIGSTVVLENRRGVEAAAETDSAGMVYFSQITHEATEASIQSKFLSYRFSFSHQSGVVEAVLPLSPFTVISITAACLAVALALVKHKDTASRMKPG
ncbi:MAG: matrixin family metalloprotease [Candidatus Caldarchaeum sp.]|nr:matrixin family metalloprotease [Candidatus Caldarchaeum sp.]